MRHHEPGGPARRDDDFLDDAALGVGGRQLDGAAGNDWDLAIFDHSTGRQVGGSGAWGATEVAQTYAAAGRRLDIQACRLRGSATSVPLTLNVVGLPKVETHAPVTEQFVHIALPNRKAFNVLEGLEIDMADHGTADGIDAVIHTPEELELLRRAGFDTQVKIADLRADGGEQRTRTRRTPPPRAPPGRPCPRAGPSTASSPTMPSTSRSCATSTRHRARRSRFRRRPSRAARRWASRSRPT